MNISVALMLLSFSAGATDAFTFMLLGGIFTANMTGNVVLMGLVYRDDYSVALIGAIVALICFTLGLFMSFYLCRRMRLESGPTLLEANVLLGITCAAQSLTFAGWLMAGGQTGRLEQLCFVGLTALAMACQTVAARRMSASSGITTTYVSGTLTNLVEDRSEGRGGSRTLRLVAIIMLALGALACALIMGASPLLGPFLPWLAVVAAIIIANTAARQPGVARP